MLGRRFNRARGNRTDVADLQHGRKFVFKGGVESSMPVNLYGCLWPSMDLLSAAKQKYLNQDDVSGPIVFEKSSVISVVGEPQTENLKAQLMSNSDRIIRLKTVLARTGLSRSTLYRKIAEGTFPAQIKISVHGAGWRESSVNIWIADPATYREGHATTGAR